MKSDYELGFWFSGVSFLYVCAHTVQLLTGLKMGYVLFPPCPIYFLSKNVFFKKKTVMLWMRSNNTEDNINKNGSFKLESGDVSLRKECEGDDDPAEAPQCFHSHSWRPQSQSRNLLKYQMKMHPGNCVRIKVSSLHQCFQHLVLGQRQKY